MFLQPEPTFSGHRLLSEGTARVQMEILVYKIPRRPSFVNFFSNGNQKYLSKIVMRQMEAELY